MREPTNPAVAGLILAMIGAGVLGAGVVVFVGLVIAPFTADVLVYLRSLPTPVFATALILFGGIVATIGLALYRTAPPMTSASDHLDELVGENDA